MEQQILQVQSVQPKPPADECKVDDIEQIQNTVRCLSNLMAVRAAYSLFVTIWHLGDTCNRKKTSFTCCSEIVFWDVDIFSKDIPTAQTFMLQTAGLFIFIPSFIFWITAKSTYYFIW